MVLRLNSRSICGKFHKVNAEGGSKLSSFSRRHYQAIADIIKSAETKYQVAQDLAKMFADDNDRFDCKKFFKACGILLVGQNEGTDFQV